MKQEAAPAPVNVRARIESEMPREETGKRRLGQTLRSEIGYGEVFAWDKGDAEFTSA